MQSRYDVLIGSLKCLMHAMGIRVVPLLVPFKCTYTGVMAYCSAESDAVDRKKPVSMENV